MSRSGQLGEIVAAEGDYADVSISPDQSRVAYSRVDPQSQAPDIWIQDLARGTATRVTSERLVDASPIWSPDGNQIIFRSNRSSTIGVELYVTSASPGGMTQLVYGINDNPASGNPSNVVPCDWLPDGQVVFYQATLRAGYGIWIKSLTQKNPRALLDTPYNEVQAAISPDGAWMAYASDLSGRYEVYVQDFPAGANRTLVSTHGGMQPRWGERGRELYYLQADGTLMQVAVQTGQRFNGAAPKPLFKTTIPNTVNPYRTDYVPTADGQRFLMKVPVKEPAPVITVVVNWPALLKGSGPRQ